MAVSGNAGTSLQGRGWVWGYSTEKPSAVPKKHCILNECDEGLVIYFTEMKPVLVGNQNFSLLCGQNVPLSQLLI